MKCPYYIKQCTKCGKLLIAWKGNFRKKKNGKCGFASQCKECDKQYYEENKDEILKRNKKYREEHKEEIAEQKKQYREEHKEEITEYQKQYYENNKEEILECQKEYREEHKEEILKYQKQYYENNKEEILEYKKLYYEEHKEYKKQYYEEHKKKILKNQKQYKENNPHVRFNNNIKRRQLEENQGRDITKEQWYEMMCWFDWCCAYSGEYIGGDNTDKKRTIDHIIPISKGGLNEPWNCIPCFANYNYSKNTNNMEEWYIQQEFYSEERLIKIYAWCEYAFNKWKPRRKGNKKNNIILTF